MKTCSKCKDSKDIADFNSGQNYCRECQKVARKEYCSKNKEQLCAYSSAYRKANPEKRVIHNKSYRTKHVEQIAAKDRAYRLNNKEKVFATRKKYREENAESIRNKKKVYAVLNADKLKEKRMNYYLANKTAMNMRSKAHRESNKDKPEYKAKQSAYASNYSRTNRAERNAALAKYRAAKLRATPVWRDDFTIDEIYSLAELRTKVTGISWNVDHIVPLQSKLVCGLHCEANLRVIPAVENLSKNNRHWPDMPEVNHV